MTKEEIIKNHRRFKALLSDLIQVGLLDPKADEIIAEIQRLNDEYRRLVLRPEPQPIETEEVIAR